MSVRGLQKYELDPNDDASVLKFFETRWQNKDFYKGNLERRWLNNIAKYEGFYYLNYDTALKRFEENNNMPSWRVKLVSNLALPVVRTAATKFMRNRPIPDVLPAKLDTEGIERADLQKKFLRAFYYKHNLNYQFVDLVLWVGLTGNGFTYICWDPDSGPIHKVTPQDFINPDLVGQVSSEEELATLLRGAQDRFEQFVQQNQSTSLPLGEIKVTVVSPFEMLFPFASEFATIPWCMQGTIRDTNYFVEKGINPDILKPPTQRDARYLYYARRVNNLIFMGQAQSQPDTGPDDDEVLELKGWIPKSRKFPEGFECVIAGGKVVDKSVLKYRHGLLPFVHYTAERTPGKIWANSSLDYALPLIEERQHILSQLIEIKNMTAKPKILAPRTSALLSEAWTSEPGEIVEYSGLQAPQPWTPPSVPRYVFDLLNVLNHDMADITAQRDATKGINPSGVRSATALVNLQDQDDGQLAILGLILDTGKSIEGRMMLAIADQYYTEDRLLTFVGEKGRVGSVLIKPGSFSGQDLTPGIDYYNTRVTQYSQYGLTRAGQLEFLKVLLQYQIYTSADRSKILQFIQMGYFEDDLDENKQDRANANNENILMSQGTVLQPSMFEAHSVHLEEHEYFMKTDEFKRLPPQIQQIFNMHYNMTNLLKYMKLTEPRVLGMKALLLSAAQEKLPLQLFVGQQPNAQ